VATDKNTERERYEQRAAAGLEASGALAVLGAAGVSLELRRPYLRFEELLRETVRPDDRVLDLCCGDGQFSFVAAETVARVTGLDLSAASLELAARRCPDELRKSVDWAEGDCEQLPFPDGSFSGVVCAGGLSYGEWVPVLDEIVRVLRPDGWLIVVDSYNHNPLYRLNRWLHRLSGRRTVSVNRRIPSRRWLALARERFANLEVEHFGVFTFLAPLLRPVAGSERTARWLDRWDACACAPREWAFKIVVKAVR
jgi:SAM-dependent methyltransferase